MDARVLAVFILFASALYLIGQSVAPPSSDKASPNAEGSLAPSPAASGSPMAAGPELKLVVALFRHGVRAPLSQIDPPPKKPHARDPWPPPSQWGVAEWGDLTGHGIQLVQALGCDYAERYKKMLPAGFKGFLWADVDERTRETAKALKRGLNACGVTATVDSRSEGPDPLFHPFAARCGVPDGVRLRAIAHKITVNSQSWIDSKYAKQFGQLYTVLACTDSTKCDPLKSVTDNGAVPCLFPVSGCSDPIEWQGQFRYANTVSETFLLEYANKMAVDWTRVLEPPPDETAKLLSLMALHEFYFDQTQRDGYVSTIEASNLIREISQTLNGVNAPCRRIPAGYQFAALVGHDTNIANVATLLDLRWQFSTAPVGTRGLPDNDPLPAGALLFELWREGNDSFVRVSYAAQGLREMRTFSAGSCPAFHLPIRCDPLSVEPNACKIPLKKFNDAVAHAMGQAFLSRCEDGQQACGGR